MDKIKVLYIYPSCITTIGGVQSYISNVFDELRKEHNVNLEFLTSDPKSKRIYTKITENIKIHYVPAYVFDNSFFFSLKLIRYYKKIYKRFNLIHIHGYHSFFPIVSLFTKKIPIVFTPHFHEFPKRSSRKLLFWIYNKTIGKLIISKVNFIILNSPDLKPIFLRIFNVNPEKVMIFNEGIRPSYCNYKIREAILPDGPNVLYVGRLEKNKGVYRLLQVMKKMKEKYNNSSLVIIGSGIEKQNMKRKISEYTLDKNVTIKSNISNSELGTIAKKSDIFLMLSDYETFGLALAESIASGIPSIAVNTGGVKVYAKNGVNCLLIDNPDEIDLIICKIEELIKDKTLRKKLSKNGKQIAEAFSWKTNASHTLELYKLLLESYKETE